MKNLKLFLLTIAITTSYSLTAQVAVNTSGNSAHEKAMLDVTSTDKGMLIPRMTEAQRDDINPDATATGLIIYQTDGTAGFYYYNGSNWIGITGAGEGAISNSSCIDYDGNAYPTFTIGNQVWMAESLRVTHYRNGDVIPYVTGGTEWEELSTDAYCCYENNQVSNEKYGNLYNWFAVDDSRGLCPEGWHVPTDVEWTMLTTYLGGKPAMGATTIAGGKMKSISVLWDSPNYDATNNSGFSGLPGGYRNTNGTFNDLGSYGYWWSSSELSLDNAWSRGLDNNTGLVSIDNYRKQYGFSVRCLRDF